MAIRGRLAVDDTGRLVMIDPNAADPTNPDPGDIEPLQVDQLDANQLATALDANGQDITGVGLNEGTDLQYELADINQLASIAYPTTNQTISTGTVTKLHLDASIVNDTSVASVDTNNQNIVIQEDGLYRITGLIRWNPDTGWSTGDRAEINFLNAGGDSIGERTVKVGTGSQTAKLSITEELVTNDLVNLNIYQESGVDQTIDGAVGSSRLEVVRMG